MSEIDKRKEEKEYQTFLDACNYCSNNNVNIVTKNLMIFLNGEKVERKKQDRPDIITRCKRGKKEIIVGIEAFYVDQNSGLKSGKYKSKSKESWSKINGIYEKGHNQLNTDGKVSDENNMQLLQKVGEFSRDRLNSSVDDLINAFKHHFDHHADQAEQYKNAIKEYSNGEKIELAFFIEIETCFHNLFVFHNNKIIRYESMLMPFFSEIISIIENHPNKEYIDYIVFYLKANNPDEEKVVAIRAGQIRKNLEKQGIIIFKKMIDRSVKIKIEPDGVEKVDNKGFSLTYEIQIDKSRKFEIEQKIYNFVKRNIPFIMSQ